MLTTQVKLLQKVAIWSGKTVLLLQRGDTEQSRPGCWDLPGGNSEWPEAGRQGFGLHREDIAREVREETGLVFEASQFSFDALTYFETFFEQQAQRFSVICGWGAVLPAENNPDSITLSSEHTSYDWVRLSELDAYDFGGKRGEFILEIITRSANHGTFRS